MSIIRKLFVDLLNKSNIEIAEAHTNIEREKLITEIIDSEINKTLANITEDNINLDIQIVNKNYIRQSARSRKISVYLD